MTIVARRSKALLTVAAAAIAASLLIAAAASARDAHRRSFVETRILVHFFPAAGLKAHKRAPTVLMSLVARQPQALLDRNAARGGRDLLRAGGRQACSAPGSRRSR